MVRRHHAGKFGFVLRATIEGCIDGYFLLSDSNHLDVRSAPLTPNTWSGTEDGRFAEAELEPA